MNRKIIFALVALLLCLCLGLTALADTIRLKDGSVIRGQVIGFKDQQFTVLIGTGGRGRRSRVTLYMEDVESIEFDSSGIAANDDTDAGGNQSVPNIQPRPNTSRPAAQPPASQPDMDDTPQPGGRQTTPSQASPTFFQINARVRGDNASNGWTNSGLVVRRGQRLRIRANGQIALGAGRTSTPGGVATLPDRDKLMRSEPTGALIAVIGDDNDDFILIGRSREFIAQRDGVLFLGVNEGNLNDNTGSYEVIIEAEAMGR
ncbi:MAG TPA: hypothetical protein VF723_03650 [Pyrinomonadaceae bacterium]|jgi:hypothetical protein